MSEKLTGQEWYNKFEKEWNRLLELPAANGQELIQYAVKAAKRAAGIEVE